MSVAEAINTVEDLPRERELKRLRDEFAMAASEQDIEAFQYKSSFMTRWEAKYAYADAMLAERAKKGTK